MRHQPQTLPLDSFPRFFPQAGHFLVFLAMLWRVQIRAVTVGLLLLAGRQAAEASYCGSYVTAHPTSTQGKRFFGGMDLVASGEQAAAHPASRDGNPMPHLPTPCERGQCHGPGSIPFTPPSVPSARPVEHLLLQISSAMTHCGEKSSHFFSNSARARAGFYRQLEQPPDSLVS